MKRKKNKSWTIMMKRMGLQIRLVQVIFVSPITYKFSFQDVYWNSYFRSQYIFYVPPVIYYESDIQTEINIPFFFFLKFPIRSDVYIGLLICFPHFISLLSLYVSILTLFSTNVLPRYVLGYWYCHPSPEYTTRIMYWFWRGKFEYVRCPFIK